MIDPILVVAALMYFAIAARFFYVFSQYQSKVLAVPGLYKNTDHAVFKTMIVVSTMMQATIAPLVSFFIPSYINVFFDGIELKRS